MFVHVNEFLVDSWLHRTERAHDQNDYDAQSLFAKNVTAKPYQPGGVPAVVRFDQPRNDDEAVQPGKTKHPCKQHQFYDQELAVGCSQIGKRPDEEP